MGIGPQKMGCRQQSVVLADIPGSLRLLTITCFGERGFDMMPETLNRNGRARMANRSRLPLFSGVESSF